MSGGDSGLSAADLVVDHRLALLSQSFRLLLEVTPVDADDLGDDFLGVHKEPESALTGRWHGVVEVQHVHPGDRPADSDDEGHSDEMRDSRCPTARKHGTRCLARGRHSAGSGGGRVVGASDTQMESARGGTQVER